MKAHAVCCYSCNLVKVQVGTGLTLMPVDVLGYCYKMRVDESSIVLNEKVYIWKLGTIKLRLLNMRERTKSR